MKKHVLYCRPAGGLFNWEKKTYLKNTPGKLSKHGRVKVTFEKYVPLKSLSQLRYYRGPMLQFIEKERALENGLTVNEWHDYFKGEFGIKRVDATGKFEVIVSHADYTEKQMSKFIQDVIYFCWHEFRLSIPAATEIGEYLD